MQNKATKSPEEALAEIYRNAQLALVSIADILPAVEDEKCKTELHAEHEKYEHFSAQAARIARDKGIELKEPNPMKKVMMWGSIKMSTLTDNSREHIADMMLQGTVMGISALRTTASDYVAEDQDEILSLLHEMIKTEEEFEKNWKSLL